MAKVQSIFGTYAEQLQAVVDNSLSLFAPTWYQKYFTISIPCGAIRSAILQSCALSVLNFNSLWCD